MYPGYRSVAVETDMIVETCTATRAMLGALQGKADTSRAKLTRGARHTSWLTSSNVGFSSFIRSLAIRLSAVLSKTTTQSACSMSRFIVSMEL